MGAANISCLSTKRSKKWAKSCKKGQKCLQIRLSVNSYHFSAVICRQAQNCLSNSMLQLNSIQCELFSLSLWIFLFLFVDLIDSLTESFPMCLTGPMGINQNPRDSHNFISNYCHQHKLNCHQHKVNCHQHKVNCHQHKLNCHQHKLNFHQHRSICHQKKLIVI